LDSKSWKIKNKNKHTWTEIHIRNTLSISSYGHRNQFANNLCAQSRSPQNFGSITQPLFVNVLKISLWIHWLPHRIKVFKIKLTYSLEGLASYILIRDWCLPASILAGVVSLILQRVLEQHLWLSLFVVWLCMVMHGYAIFCRLVSHFYSAINSHLFVIYFHVRHYQLHSVLIYLLLAETEPFKLRAVGRCSQSNRLIYLITICFFIWDWTNIGILYWFWSG